MKTNVCGRNNEMKTIESEECDVNGVRGEGNVLITSQQLAHLLLDHFPPPKLIVVHHWTLFE